MKHVPAHRLAFFVFGMAALLGALYAAALVLGWGEAASGPLSGSRLGPASLLFLFALIFAGLLVALLRDPSLSDRLLAAYFEQPGGRRLLLAAASLLVLVGALALLPGYRLSESLAAYLTRLHPLLSWLGSLGLGAILLLLWVSARETGPAPLAPSGVARTAGLLLAAFLLGWLFVWLTGLGLSRREDYWYGAGVPALPLQVLFSLLAGLCMARLERSFRSRLRLDALLFALIWAASAWLWAREPINPSYFMPGPFRPSGDFYPFSDGLLFDLGGQFALIGQGILNGAVFDRALYMVWSTYLHALAGQQFLQAMAVQAALFAVLPAALYLLGKELHSRSLGVAVAVLAALRGLNSIAAARWIDLANPKMTLTDFPTAIGVVLFTLFVVRWLKSPEKNWQHAIWAGAALGFAAMLRTHTLLLLPVAALLSVLVYRARWRPWLIGMLLLVLGMLAATTPWDLRNQARGAPPFALYFSRIQLILQERYNWPLEDARLPAPQDDPGGLRLAAGVQPSRGWQAPAGPCETQACRFFNHLLHNVTTSVLSLPTSWILDDLRFTVKEALPYWEQDWRGEGFDLGQGLLLALNLALLAFGIALAWRALGWVGLVPLGVYLTYIFSNALAFTSGGRYIVPADWVPSLYFLLGALQLLGWAACRLGWSREALTPGQPLEQGEQAAPARARQWPRVVVPLLVVLALGSLMPLSEQLYPPRYPEPPNRAETLAIFRPGGLVDLQSSELLYGELKRFLSEDGAGVWQGRMLYPRHYLMGAGELTKDVPYDIRPYPRMAFTLIGPSGQYGVILAGGVRGRFDNAVDVLVVGCELPGRKNAQAWMIDALAVYVLEQPSAGFVRSPMPPLKCPLREPVCINQGQCY